MSKSEKEVEKCFNYYKKHIISNLGEKGLYDTTIEENCRRLFKSKWIACVSHDKMRNENGYQILNTSGSKSKVGIHWVGIVQTDKIIYVYDSFGRNYSNILKTLSKLAKKYKKSIKESDKDPEQFGNSEICGSLCISWLLCVQQFGIRKAMLI